MGMLEIDPQPMFRAFISDAGYYCITSECPTCGRESTFSIPRDAWNQIKNFFALEESGEAY